MNDFMESGYSRVHNAVYRRGGEEGNLLWDESFAWKNNCFHHLLYTAASFSLSVRIVAKTGNFLLFCFVCSHTSSAAPVHHFGWITGSLAARLGPSQSWDWSHDLTFMYLANKWYSPTSENITGCRADVHSSRSFSLFCSSSSLFCMLTADLFN